MTTDPLVGDVLDGRYEVLTRLARGGMATVYRAWDRRLERIVAIKVMHDGLGDDADFVAKFDREARAAARLCDKNVVAIFDQGHDHGRPYIVMEFVEGATLRNVITAEAPMSPLRALQMIESVAAALAVAHDSGLVHRDVKPENVLISDRGSIKVADFGLARSVNSQTATATQGLLIGTVSYLPPELLTSGHAHSWSDVYSTGIMLFEMLTGSKPYAGETPITVAYKHVNEDVPPPSVVLRRNHPQQARREPIPDYLDALVMACTRRNPDARPADGRELLRRVRRARRAIERGISNDESLTTLMYPASALPWSAAPLANPAAATAELPAVPLAADELSPVDSGSISRQVPVTGTRPRTPIGAPVPAVPAARPGTRPPIRGASYDFTADDEVPAGHYDDEEPLFRRPDRSPVAAVQRGASPTYRRRRAMVLVLVLLLVGTLGTTGWWFTSGRYTAAPAVLNQSRADAAAIAEANGMGIVFTEQYSETVPPGLVISSVPEPGERVVRGTEIAAVVSLGPERFAVPPLVGLALEDARAALAAASLATGAVVEAWSETTPAGIVVGATHAEGELLPRDAPVDLTVSKGREPVTIPSVVNMTVEDASKMLTDAGFTVQVAKEESHESIAAGMVISQSPANGTGFRGDEVQLVVSKGKELVKMPDLKGDDLDEALDELEELGLEAEVEWERPMPFPRDRVVVNTDPKEGTELSPGDTVKVRAK